LKTLQFALGSILFVAFFATVSMAQNGRTFVSEAGLDTNPCSLTSPCRTFGQAISVTNAGGEVVVLTSAGYGPFAINKAITVEAPAGVYAGITVTSGDGIDINAQGNDVVILRGLTVNNQGSGGNGIVFNTGGTLHIESCIANGFSSNNGIAINGPGSIVIKDTIARGNDTGIQVTLSAAGTASIAMDQLHLDANVSAGLVMVSTVSGAVVQGAIRNSSASNNPAVGMQVIGNSSGIAVLNIANCLITNNGTGVEADQTTGGTGTESISDCIITNNQNGFFIMAGTISSLANNTLTGNVLNTGTLTPLIAH